MIYRNKTEMEGFISILRFVVGKIRCYDLFVKLKNYLGRITLRTKNYYFFHKILTGSVKTRFGIL